MKGLADMQLSNNPMPPLTDQEFAKLKESIRVNGVMNAATTSSGPYRPGALIDGAHRKRACTELGIECPTISRPIANEIEFKIHQIESNTTRRHLPLPLRAKYATQLLNLYQEQANGRKKAGKKLDGEIKGGRATELVGKSFGVPRNIVEAQIFIQKHGDATTVAKVLSGEIKHHTAVRQIKRAISTQDTLAMSIKGRIKGELPKGKFGAIIITPPLRANPKKSQKGKLSLKEIAALDIRAIATDSTVVALMLPPGGVEDGFATLKRWGANYLTMLTWARDTPVQNTLSERCVYTLIGTFGTPPPKSSKRDVIIGGSRTADIPPDLFDLLDEWSPKKEGIVMFGNARDHQGWHTWEPAID